MTVSESPEGYIKRAPAGRPYRFVNVAHQQSAPSLVKEFSRKEIWLPEERDLYEATLPKDALWLGVTGWTAPPKEFSEKYGTSDEEGIYQKLVTALLIDTAACLRERGIDTDLRHGASNVGVDGAALDTMDLTGVSGSGVNCPKFMQWVDDDTRGGPVYVAEDKEAYHIAFADFQRNLVVTGGRYDAFYHDYLNRIAGDGYSVIADVIQVISETEVPGSEPIEGSEERSIVNAAALIREKNSLSFSPVPRTYDWLLASTRFLVLRNAYEILGREPDNDGLQELSDMFYQEADKYRKAPPPIVTAAELDERIARGAAQYRAL